MEQIGEVRLTESTEAESEALNGLIGRDYDQYLRLPGACGAACWNTFCVSTSCTLKTSMSCVPCPC